MFRRYGLTGPFAAALMQTLGIRRVVITALLLMAAATGSSALMTQHWQLIATWGVLSGVASGCVAVVLGATIVNRWFAARRGLVDRGCGFGHARGMRGEGTTRTYRGVAGGLRWELIERAPSPALAPYIRELQGYSERSSTPVLRREFGGTRIVVILEFEPHLRVYDSADAQRFQSFPGGFVGGLDERSTLTEHAGVQAGIQLNLHPLGARRVLGLPLSELRGQCVSFVDLVPSERHLTQELTELPSWEARFARVERFVLERLHNAPEVDASVRWALDRLGAVSGQLSVEQLARELGYSHKHVIARFHDQVGVPPKLWARLLRFERLRTELQRGTPRTWAELAVTCGYYDQAHLARDVKRFTGAPPSALLGPQPTFQATLG